MNNHRDTEHTEIIAIDTDKRSIVLSQNTPNTFRFLQYVGANDVTDNHREWIISPVVDFDRIVVRLQQIVEGIYD